MTVKASSANMCCTREGWVVATSVGVVEALKDQGYCRWNNSLRSIQQHANNHIRSASQANKKLSSSSSSSISKKLMEDHEKMDKSEESLRTVMFLSCWGPNT